MIAKQGFYWSTSHSMSQSHIHYTGSCSGDSVYNWVMVLAPSMFNSPQCTLSWASKLWHLCIGDFECNAKPLSLHDDLIRVLLDSCFYHCDKSIFCCSFTLINAWALWTAFLFARAQTGRANVIIFLIITCSSKSTWQAQRMPPWPSVHSG